MRTPAGVVASLFRDPATDSPVAASPRPHPVGKHVRASLTTPSNMSSSF